MTKLFESANDKSQATLQKLHAELLPAVFLWKVPKKDKFAQIRFHFPNDDYWPSTVGKVCEVRVRYKIRFEARLMSCVFKKFKDLTDEDAIACGYSNDNSLDSLKASLTKRMSRNPHWKGDYTELEILSFEKV